MWMLLPALAWDALVATLIVRAVIQSFHYRKLAQARGSDGLGSISVIVPARNEAEKIEACIGSLAKQDYPASRLQILVVDDQSSDETALRVRRLTRQYPRVRLLSSTPLPPGWTGKAHACWLGALAAEGNWLCFIDADTVSEPALLASAVACASDRGLGMLSLAPSQQLGGFFERLLIPSGVLVVAFTQDQRQFNKNDSDQASANGQFLLFPREVYFGVGGHREVRAEICEDRALARNVKHSGASFTLLGAENLIRTRMYTSFSALWEGFSKNVTEMLGGTARTLAISGGMLAVAVAACLGPLAMWHFASGARLAAWATAIWLLGSAALAGMHIATAVRFRVPWWYGLLFPAGYAIGAAIALNGIRERLAGSVPWKGRVYSSASGRRPAESAPSA